VQYSSRSLPADAAILGAVMLVAIGLISPIAWLLGNWPGVAVAARRRPFASRGPTAPCSFAGPSKPPLRGPSDAASNDGADGSPLFVVVACQIFGGPLANVAFLYYL